MAVKTGCGLVARRAALGGRARAVRQRIGLFFRHSFLHEGSVRGAPAACRALSSVKRKAERFTGESDATFAGRGGRLAGTRSREGAGRGLARSEEAPRTDGRTDGIPAAAGAGEGRAPGCWERPSRQRARRGRGAEGRGEGGAGAEGAGRAGLLGLSGPSSCPLGGVERPWVVSSRRRT